MLRCLLVLLTLGLTTMVQANEPPPVPEGGIAFFYESPCIDNETGEQGYCYLGQTIAGETYLTFFQNGELMMIRRVTPDGYETIWTNDRFMTY